MKIYNFSKTGRDRFRVGITYQAWLPINNLFVMVIEYSVNGRERKVMVWSNET